MIQQHRQEAVEIAAVVKLARRGSGDPLEIAAKIYDGMDTGSTLGPEHYHGRVVF